MATKTLHAVDYLAEPQKHPPRPVCVVFGDEPFLKRQSVIRLRGAVLGGDDADFSYAAFEGGKALWPDVLEELSTLAMFGGGRRMALVEEADDFVSRFRPELEDYVASPASGGVLVLELKTFPANTRLYKAVASAGLLIEGSCPSAASLTRWISAWAEQTHRIHLTSAAAGMLVEMVGPEMGLLDQELAKLALTVEPDAASAARKIAPEMIARSVGGWRAKTAWEMIDAALAGKIREAVLQLDRLLASGESPVGVLGQISASLRRLAAATRLVLQAEATGRRIALQGALERAGVHRFVLKKAEGQLRRLGRERGAELYHWLLKADLDLKGASAVPPRLILERLIVRLAAPKEALGSRQPA